MKYRIILNGKTAEDIYVKVPSEKCIYVKMNK